MSKRRIERRIEELEQTTDDGGEWFVIACEHDDGTITDLDGDELPDDTQPVLTVPHSIASTWP